MNEVEIVLFQHEAEMKKKTGQLMISASQLKFIPDDVTKEMSIVWNTIERLQYSTEKAGLKIVTESGKETVVLFLIGSNMKNNQKKLEEVKHLITERRAMYDSKNEKSKRELLEADKALRSEYVKYVHEEKLLTDEIFWNVHRRKLDDKRFGVSSLSLKPSVKSIVFSDMIGSSQNVVFSEEKKEMIFGMFPIVRFAFSEEVPTRRTEEEFWRKLFCESIYFDRISDNKRSLSRNDVFVRYRKKLNLEMRQAKERFVSSEFDLVATKNDIYTEACVVDSDYESVKRIKTEESWVASDYNSHSSYILNSFQAKTNQQERLSDSLTLNEQNVPVEPEFLRINWK